MLSAKKKRHSEQFNPLQFDTLLKVIVGSHFGSKVIGESGRQSKTEIQNPVASLRQHSPSSRGVYATWEMVFSVQRLIILHFLIIDDNDDDNDDIH